MIASIKIDDEKKMQRAIRRIVKGYSPQKIILFGSYARGDVHLGSDVDLVIVKDTEDDFLKRIGDVLSCCTGEIAVEPLVYNEDEIEKMVKRGNDFIKSVLKEGKVIYEESKSV